MTTSLTHRRTDSPARPGRGGFALVLVLVTVALAVILGFGYLTSATIQALSVSNTTQANRAHYLAESGIHHALYVLWTQPTLIDGSSFDNRLGPYQADETDDSYTMWGRQDDDDIYTLFCQATCGGVSQAVSVQVSRSAPYDEQLLDDGPAGYWRMGETAGTTVQDASGHDYDLTAFGDPAWGQAGAIGGDEDTGVRLDGTDDYMYRPPTLDLKIAGNLTISMWFKAPQMPDDLAYLLTYSEDGEQPTSNAMYEAVLNPTGSITFLMEYGSGHDIVHTFGGLSVVPNQWYNLTITRNQFTHTVKMYINGEVRGSWNYGSPGPPQANSGKNSGLYVGSAYGESNFFNGWVDELAILNHPMSPDEIRGLYEAASGENNMQVLDWNDAPTDLGG